VKIIENIFGKGVVYEEQDITGTIYFYCCACMSLYAEALSWANHPDNKQRTTPFSEADNIIFLCCQVTDLAVLNDIKTIEKIKRAFPLKNFYVSGCLSQRFDIQLPLGARRLENLKCDGQFIQNNNYVHWQRPFWVKHFDGSDSEFADGHLFRSSYPLRIGVGCKNKCKYCTIRIVRGDCYQVPLNVEEFKKALNVGKRIVLIADSPTKEQIIECCELAHHENIPISIRNIEPQVVIEIFDHLETMAGLGLLTVLHCPIQSGSPDVLGDMGRDVESTLNFIEKTTTLKPHTILATNIIVDYKEFPNCDRKHYKFDYISWNPYWDGKWDRKKAEERFEYYITNNSRYIGEQEKGGGKK